MQDIGLGSDSRRIEIGVLLKTGGQDKKVSNFSDRLEGADT